MTRMIDPGLFTQLTDEARQKGVQKLIVGAVISNGSDVLLLKRPQDDFMGGIYELPSGNVELGETLDTALYREVKEETGLDVSAVTGYLGSFDYTSASGKKVASSTSPPPSLPPNPSGCRNTTHTSGSRLPRTRQSPPRSRRCWPPTCALLRGLEWGYAGARVANPSR